MLASNDIDRRWRLIALTVALLCLNGCAWSSWQSQLADVPSSIELTTDARVALTTRLRLPASTPLLLRSTDGPRDPQLHSARAGLMSRFPSVSLASSEHNVTAGVLLILDSGAPDTLTKRTGWTLRLLPLDALLPASAHGRSLRVHLLDATTRTPLGRADLDIDPPVLRPVRGDVTRLGFEELARALTGA